MSNTIKFVLVVVVAVGLFLAGRITTPSVVVEESVVTKYDTTHHYKPIPKEILPPDFKKVRLPLVVFAPADKTRDTVVVVDSVEVYVEIQSKIYEDSTYKAQISGAVVGGVEPTLDWINIHNRTVTRVQTHNTWIPPKYEIFAEAGFDTRSQWLGVGYKRNWHPLSVEIMAGVEPFTQSTYLAARARINIFTKK